MRYLVENLTTRWRTTKVYLCCWLVDVEKIEFVVIVCVCRSRTSQIIIITSI